MVYGTPDTRMDPFFPHPDEVTERSGGESGSEVWLCPEHGVLGPVRVKWIDGELEYVPPEGAVE